MLVDFPLLVHIEIWQPVVNHSQGRSQSGDPLENAVAERANGILKTEWLYKMNIATRDECRDELERIIGFYNTERPHMSI